MRPLRALAGLASLAAALVAAALAAPRAATAQTPAITVRLGQGGGAVVAPNGSVSVPVVADVPAGAPTLASATVRLRWDPAQLAIDALDDGQTGIVQGAVVGGSNGGELRLVFFDPTGLDAGTTTLAAVRFRVRAARGTASVALAVENAADLRGQSVASRVQAGAPFSVCVSTTAELFGDADGNREIDVLDAQEVTRLALGLGVADAARVRRVGDVTGDGVVDVVDAQQIARYAAGLPAAPRIGQAVAGSCDAASAGPARIDLVTPSPLRAAVGGRVRIEARVLTAAGAPVPRQTYTATVQGFAPANFQADSLGRITLEWGAGSTAGTFTGELSIGVAGGAPIRAPFQWIVAATGTPGGGTGGGTTARRIELVGPSPIAATVGTEITVRVRVLSAAGAPEPNVDVLWRLAGYQDLTTRTGSDGTAGIRLTPDAEGALVGSATIVGSGASAPFTVNVVRGGTTAGDYTVTVVYVGQVGPSVRTAVDAAVARLRRIVRAPVGATELVGADLSPCDYWLPRSYSARVRDMTLFVSEGPMDNLPADRQPLAYANACLPHAASGLTAIGMTRINARYLAGTPQAELNETVLHEVLHAVGIGSLPGWRRASRSAALDDPFFVGTNAVGAWGRAGGMSVYPAGVPVEATGGAGTAGGHWRGSILVNELMIGWATDGASPLSAITIGALQDLGYVVDMSAADSYRVPPRALRPDAAEARGRAYGDDVRSPVGWLGPDGVVYPLWSRDIARVARARLLRAP